MGALVITDDRYQGHDPGIGHPERPQRLAACLSGLAAARLDEAITWMTPVAASLDQLRTIHSHEMVERAQAASEASAELDPDTPVGPYSFTASLLAAGAGLGAVDALREGDDSVALCLVRPPGHHATPSHSMGFCVFNNVAVTARSLSESGERVVIVDVDAHHGNGTQDAFWDDPDVLFISWHQWPLYPGSGRIQDVGGSNAVGTTMNLPLPPGATGDQYRRSLDQMVAQRIEAFDPTWMLISAGFDAHRLDPVTSMGLTSGDYADQIAVLATCVPPGRLILFLEGGYDLGALADCTGAVMSRLVGEHYRPEEPTSGGPGAEAIRSAAQLWERIEGPLA